MGKAAGVPKATVEKLQNIAALCGIAKSPPKLAIWGRIRAAVKEFKPLQPDEKIMSIDLGIRNMAYCLLTPQPTPDPFRDLGKPLGRVKPIRSSNVLAVHKWKLMSLLPTDPTNKDKIKSTDGVLTGVLADDFSPSGMAQLALKFVDEHILPLEPSHILIERQRWRSSSSSTIFQWTVRVNTLESMIYTILETYRRQGLWKGEVVPVPPKRVAAFLVNDNDATVSLLADHRSPAENLMQYPKSLKIELLKRIVDNGNFLHFAPEIPDSILFQLRGAHVRPEPKLDDLADCLLQGLAWVKWKENMAELIEKKAHPWVTELMAESQAEKSGEDTEQDGKSGENTEQDTEQDGDRDDQKFEDAFAMNSVKRERAIDVKEKAERTRWLQIEHDLGLKAMSPNERNEALEKQFLKVKKELTRMTENYYKLRDPKWLQPHMRRGRQNNTTQKKEW